MKSQSKFMSANANSVRFKLACNVPVCLISQNYYFLVKNNFLPKMAYGLGEDISCIKFPVVSDF